MRSRTLVRDSRRIIIGSRAMLDQARNQLQAGKLKRALRTKRERRPIP